MRWKRVASMVCLFEDTLIVSWGGWSYLMLTTSLRCLLKLSVVHFPQIQVRGRRKVRLSDQQIGNFSHRLISKKLVNQAG